MNKDLQDGGDRHRVARQASKTRGRGLARRPRGRRRARAIDPAVGAALAESHRNILRFVRRRIGDGAEEVLQAFFVEALGSGTQLPHAEPLRTRFGRILQRAMVEYHGKGSAWNYRAIMPSAASAVPPREEFDAAVSASLHMLLPTLKPDYAEVLWRADLVGEQRDRTAKLLGTTVNNVGVRLYRARTVLRKRLEQVCVTCPNHGLIDCACEYASAMRAAVAEEADARDDQSLPRKYQGSPR